MKGVDNLLDKYARTLLDTNRILSTIQLYRKAKYYIEAAQLLDKVLMICLFVRMFTSYHVTRLLVYHKTKALVLTRLKRCLFCVEYWCVCVCVCDVTVTYISYIRWRSIIIILKKNR